MSFYEGSSTLGSCLNIVVLNLLLKDLRLSRSSRTWEKYKLDLVELVLPGKQPLSFVQMGRILPSQSLVWGTSLPPLKVLSFIYLKMFFMHTSFHWCLFLGKMSDIRNQHPLAAQTWEFQFPAGFSLLLLVLLLDLGHGPFGGRTQCHLR